MAIKNSQLEEKVNKNFANLDDGPWFNSSLDGIGPVNYDRGNDADFDRAVDNDFGFFSFSPSPIEMPYKKLK